MRVGKCVPRRPRVGRCEDAALVYLLTNYGVRFMVRPLARTFPRTEARDCEYTRDRTDLVAP